MQKVRRVLALCGVGLLIAMYLLTLLLAIFDNSASMRMFFASVVTTILVPVMIWAYTLLYRLFNKSDEDKKDPQAAEKDR